MEMIRLLEQSAMAAVLVLVIVILRKFLLHKLPKVTFQIMWAVVILRLLIPFSVPIPVQLPLPDWDLGQNGWWGADSRKGMGAEEQEKDSHGGNPVAENWRPGENNLGDSNNRVSSEEGIKNVQEDGGMQSAKGQEGADKAQEAKQSGNGQSDKRIQLVLRAFWLAGAVLSFSYFAISHVCYRKRYAAAIPIELPGIGLGSFSKRRIRMKVSDRLPSPLTYGIFFPVILLPRITDWEDKERLRLILAHEAVHIRRLDVLYKWLMALAACLHWFNPFVWLMFFFAGRDMELSCDEAVIRRLQHDNRAEYALALLYFEEKYSVSLGFSRFSGNAVKERMEAIMKWNKTSMASAALAVLLVAGTTTVFAASAETGSSLPKGSDGKVAGMDSGSGEEREAKQYLCEPSYYTPEEFEEDVMPQRRKEMEELLGQGHITKEDAEQFLSDIEKDWKEVQNGRKIEKPSPVYHADGTPLLNSKGEQLYAKASDIERMNAELRAKAQADAEYTVVEKDAVYAGKAYPAEGLLEGNGGLEASLAETSWYTYEEYAKYAEQQKKEYADMLGEWGFNSIDGWYEWTEEVIEEACRRLDEGLEFIKKGGFISKPSGLEEDGTLMGEIMIAYYGDCLETYGEQEIQAISAVFPKEQATSEGGFWDSGYLKDYEAYGIAADETAEYYLYHGKPIAGFIDKGFRLLTDGIAKEAGGVYVKAVRDGQDKIKGVEEISMDEFAALSGLTVDER